MNAMIHTLGEESIEQEMRAAMARTQQAMEADEEFAPASEDAAIEIELVSLVKKAISGKIHKAVSEAVNSAVSTAVEEAIGKAVPVAVKSAVNKKMQAVAMAVSEALEIEPAKKVIDRQTERYIYRSGKYKSANCQEIQDTFRRRAGVPKAKANSILGMLLSRISRENEYTLSCKYGRKLYRQEAIDEACRMFNAGEIPQSFAPSMAKYFEPAEAPQEAYSL